MPEATLPSWDDGPAKSAIIDFVARVAKEGGKDYVPPAERIATFDNDGTLWNEQPMPVQGFLRLTPSVRSDRREPLHSIRILLD